MLVHLINVGDALTHSTIILMRTPRAAVVCYLANKITTQRCCVCVCVDTVCGQFHSTFVNNFRGFSHVDRGIEQTHLKTRQHRKNCTGKEESVEASVPFVRSAAHVVGRRNFVRKVCEKYDGYFLSCHVGCGRLTSSCSFACVVVSSSTIIWAQPARAAAAAAVVSFMVFSKDFIFENDWKRIDFYVSLIFRFTSESNKVNQREII